MSNELLGIVITYLITVLLAIPLGKLFAKVFKGENNRDG